MSAEQVLTDLISAPATSLFGNAGEGSAIDGSSFLGQFLTSSMMFGGSGGNASSSFFGNMMMNGSDHHQLFWNSTMTHAFIQQNIQNVILTCLPAFVVHSALFQFIISFVFYFVTGNNIFSAGIALLVAGKIWAIVTDRIYQLYYYVTDIFVYTLEIKEKENYKYNTIYICVLNWLATVDHFKKAKHLTAHAKGDVSNNHMNNNEECEADITVQLVPGPGYHCFTFKGYKITIQRVDPSSEGSDSNKKDDGQKLVLSISSWNGKKILKEVVEEAIRAFFQSEKGLTSIYTLTSDYYRDWEKLCDRPSRSFDTVYLDDDVKEKLSKDLERFLSHESFYRDNGLNYQRGYLLYGPPGSGKSSLILALAAKLKCCLFSVSLSDKSLDDTRLLHMLTKLPKRGIILLEDIDAAFNENRKASEDVQKVTFSGLLNALDGVASHSQFPRLIFMTTNHIERLEPALVRPGRIDYKIKFDFSTKVQIKQMATRFFSNEELGSKIAELVPEKKLTTAEIQTYLMRYLYEPDECLLHVEEYLKEVEDLRLQFEKAKKEEEEKEKEEELVIADDAVDKKKEVDEKKD